jgi:hypothetical protein
LDDVARGLHAIHLSLLQPDGELAGGEDEIEIEVDGGASGRR